MEKTFGFSQSLTVSWDSARRKWPALSKIKKARQAMINFLRRNCGLKMVDLNSFSISDSL